VTAGGATYYTNPYTPEFGATTFYNTQPTYNIGQYGNNNNNDEYGDGEEDYDDGADLEEGEGDYSYDDESANLPNDGAGYNGPYSYANYGAGFLPNPYQNMFVPSINTITKGAT
jgi:hypothetical protein